MPDAGGRHEIVPPPPDEPDPVIEFYKKDVDRSLLRKNLELTPAERASQLVRVVAAIEELRRGQARFRSPRA